MLRSCWLRLVDGWLERHVLQRRGSAQTADHDIRDWILILVLPHVALDRLLDVLSDRASVPAPPRLRGCRDARGRPPRSTGRRPLSPAARFAASRAGISGQRAERVHHHLADSRVARFVQAAAASGRRPSRPTSPAPRWRSGATSLSRIVERFRQIGDRLRRQRRIQAPDGERQVPPDLRIVVLTGSSNALTSAGRASRSRRTFGSAI